MIQILLFALALSPPAPIARSQPISTTFVDDEAALKKLGEELQRLLSAETKEVDWFLENYAPSARASISDVQIRALFGILRRDLPDAKLRAARMTGAAKGEIVLFSEETDQAGVFEVTTESEAPYRIMGLGVSLVPGDPVVDGIVDGMSTEDMQRVTDAFVSQLTEQDRFSGALLLAKDGEPVFQKAWGLASRRFDVPNQIDTRFNLGSMNKMFTAVAICQLAEKGELNLDDELIEHLPDYPNREVAEQITIHQLLTHTSGMGSFWEAMFERDWTKLRTPADHLDLFANDPLDFEPGTRFSYSNSGFLVLGLVIEAVTGESYYDYVRQHIFATAGMASTDSWAVDEPVKNLAMGYTRVGEDGHSPGGPLRSNIFLHRARGGPAGGGYSTVGDLLRFANALRRNELLGPDMTSLLLEGKVDTGWGADHRYAYGFTRQSVEGHDRFGHSGGAPGISADLAVLPADGFVVVVLANCDEAASFVSGRIVEMIVRSDD